MKSIRVKALCAVFAGVAIGIGAAGQAAAGTPKRGGILKYVGAGEPPRFDRRL